MRKRSLIAGALAAVLAIGAPIAAGVQAAPDRGQRADEIVVTARCSGIPLWRVEGPHGPLVLVGSIEDVARDTRWNSAALVDALRQADRVMYPDTQAIVVTSPFKAIGYLSKWRAQASLPKGRSLADMLPPDQFARLAALQRRGLLKLGFERRHPFHLARALRDRADGRLGPSAEDFVRRTVK